MSVRLAYDAGVKVENPRGPFLCRWGFHRHKFAGHRDVWTNRYGWVNVYDKVCARCGHEDCDVGL